MFGNPLKQTAENYLFKKDYQALEAEKALLAAGTSSIPVLLEAMVKRLKQLEAVALTKKDIQDFSKRLKEGVDSSNKWLEAFDREFADTPETGGGMSIAQMFEAQAVVEKVWNFISRFGEPGLRALFNVLNGNKKTLRLAAALALSNERHPNRYILNSVITSVPMNEKVNGPDPIFELVVSLLLRTLVFAGDKKALDYIEKICNQNGWDIPEFIESTVNTSIQTIHDMK